jgi:transposase
VILAAQGEYLTALGVATPLVMDERLQFVARRIAGEPMAELCREFGISRKTGYKIFDRYQECGIQGLTDRSRRPCRYAHNFDEIVENDAVWTYKFQSEYNKKIKDPDDIYLEIKDSKERRKKKGLPPRLVILPGWDMSDEERYDEQVFPNVPNKADSSARNEHGALPTD